MEENNGVGVSLTREGKTLMISNNPYYYNQMRSRPSSFILSSAVLHRISCGNSSIAFLIAS